MHKKQTLSLLKPGGTVSKLLGTTFHTELISSDFFQITLTACITSAIFAIKSDIVTFIHVKSIKVASDFNLRRMKKICQMVLTCKKNQKQILKLSTIDEPPGVPGVSKDAPGSTKFEFGGLVH